MLSSSSTSESRHHSSSNSNSNNNLAHSNSSNTSSSARRHHSPSTTATSTTTVVPSKKLTSASSSSTVGSKSQRLHTSHSSGVKDNRRSNSKQPPLSASSAVTAAAATTATTHGHGATTVQSAYYDNAHSESEDSYIAGGGFISEMDEHDSAFDGAMEYDDEDGRSLLGDDFDASSDVAVEVKDTKEKRRSQFQERLLKLELEFEENKQTIFSYQMARYKEEMDAILNGIHPDFHDQLQDLAEARDAAIASARLYRDYQFECAQQAYELETEMAEDEYMNEREGLREKMLAVIDNKRRALRDDKENLDIANDFALEPVSRAHHTRKLRKRVPETEINKGPKRKANMPAPVRWVAVDSDALEDLNSMRKVVPSGNTTKKTGTVKKK
ncbi:Sin3 histone deacetylase corepressor complex component SDS3 [Mortierella alpina]|nr:Sin3 histone deacetylase corepressor complex component SDS3 [Mortierella alpina]